MPCPHQPPTSAASTSRQHQPPLFCLPPSLSRVLNLYIYSCRAVAAASFTMGQSLFVGGEPCAVNGHLLPVRYSKQEVQQAPSWLDRMGWTRPRSAKGSSVASCHICGGRTTLDLPAARPQTCVLPGGSWFYVKQSRTSSEYDTSVCRSRGSWREGGDGKPELTELWREIYWDGYDGDQTSVSWCLSSAPTQAYLDSGHPLLSGAQGGRALP